MTDYRVVTEYSVRAALFHEMFEVGCRFPGQTRGVGPDPGSSFIQQLCSIAPGFRLLSILALRSCLQTNLRQSAGAMPFSSAWRFGIGKATSFSLPFDTSGVLCAATLKIKVKDKLQ